MSHWSLSAGEIGAKRFFRHGNLDSRLLFGYAQMFVFVDIKNGFAKTWGMHYVGKCSIGNIKIQASNAINTEVGSDMVDQKVRWGLEEWIRLGANKREMTTKRKKQNNAFAALDA